MNTTLPGSPANICKSPLVVALAFLLALTTAQTVGAQNKGEEELRRQLMQSLYDTKRIELQFKDIEREITRLNVAGAKQEAAGLSTRLKSMKRQMTGKLATNPAVTELHVVGLYEGWFPAGKPQGVNHPQGTAEVHVNYASQPMVLVLCAYEPVLWTVELRKQVTLKRVILSGYYKQEVQGLPANVPVVNESGKTGRLRSLYAYKKSDVRKYRQLATTLKKETKLDISTLQGMYACKGSPFVIGPNNLYWRVQLLASRIAPLHAASTAFERKRQRTRFGAVRFHAVSSSTVARPRLFDTGPQSWGEFSPSGPIAGTHKPLPRQIFETCVDPANSVHYAIRHHSVGKVNPKTGKFEEWTLDSPKLPKLSWPCGLAFDTKRRRLVLASLGGEGYLYAYSIRKQKWSLLSSLKNVDLQSLTYAPETDALYGIHGLMFGRANRFGGGPRGRASETSAAYAISKYSNDGRLIQQVPVKGLALGGGRGHFEARAQLIAAGRLLAILTPPLNDPAAAPGRLITRCYLVNPETGVVVYSEVFQKRDDTPRFQRNDLPKLWKGLLQADFVNRELNAWNMAAGGELTVQFIQKNFKPMPKTDAKVVGALIDKLGAADFSERAAAHKKLANLGTAALMDLEKAAKNNTSAEIRARCRLIIKSLQQGVSPELRRELFGVDILARIGTPAARKLLETLAKESEVTARSKSAREALERLPKR